MTPGDEKSKQYFTNFLIRKGFAVYDCDTHIEKGVKRPDIIATKNGQKIYFELKQRDCNSDTFDTLVISDDKLWLRQYLNAYYVFFYRDNKGCIINVHTEPYKTDVMNAKKTTRFACRAKVEKVFLHYTPDQCKWFDINSSEIY